MTATRFLEMLVSLAAQATLLVTAVAFLMRRIESVRGRDMLWSVCHLLLLLLAVGDASLPHLRLLPPLFSAPAVSYAQLPMIVNSIGLIVAVVWCIGAVGSLLLLAAGVARNVRVLRRSVPAPGEWAQAVISHLESLPRSDSARTDLCLRVHPEISTPFCWQIQQPVIVIPAAMLSYPQAEVCPILRHELAHLRMGHPLQLFLQQLVLAVFWFHPMVRWSMRQAAIYRELDCDCQAVESREEVASYLRGLLRLSRPEVISPTLPELTLHFNARGKFLLQRAEELASPRSVSRDRPREWRIIGIIPLLAMFLLFTCWLTFDINASHRSLWSPWPQWSATALHAVGFTVRDFEIDGHRRVGHEHFVDEDSNVVQTSDAEE